MYTQVQMKKEWNSRARENLEKQAGKENPKLIHNLTQS